METLDLEQAAGPIEVHQATAQQTAIDYLIPRKTVEKMSGLSRATIYRLIKARKFPPPRSIGTGAVRWKLSEVIAWQQSLNPSL